MNVVSLVPAAWIGLMLLCLAGSGCSVIGLAVDASRGPDTLAREIGDRSMDGRFVLLVSQEGDTLAGECRGRGNLPPAVYRDRYAARRAEVGRESLPWAPGDTLLVGWKDKRVVRGVLEGFTQISVVIRPQPEARSWVQRQNLSVSVPFAEIDSLRGLDGSSIEGRLLGSRIAAGRVPTMDALLLRRGDDHLWIPLSDVDSMVELDFRYQWFHNGAIADAVGLAILLGTFALRQP